MVGANCDHVDDRRTRGIRKLPPRACFIFDLHGRLHGPAAALDDAATVWPSSTSVSPPRTLFIANYENDLVFLSSIPLQQRDAKR